MIPLKLARFRRMAELARQRRVTAPSYPDDPEALAEQEAIARALAEGQARAQVTLYTSHLPVSEAHFDYAPPELRALAEPHFADGHTIWAEVTIRGVEKLECCGTVLWQREDA